MQDTPLRGLPENTEVPNHKSWWVQVQLALLPSHWDGGGWEHLTCAFPPPRTTASILAPSRKQLPCQNCPWGCEDDWPNVWTNPSKDLLGLYFVGSHTSFES